jgi:hypothetical protein
MLNRHIQLLILLLLPLAALAERENSGDWWISISENDGYTEAFTANESGSTFGLVCLTNIDRCFFYISPQTTCNDGSASIVLINSDAGALSSKVTCTKLGDNFYSMIEDFDNVQSAIIKSNNIGIALPMESGLFKVVRFSLIGANAAIKKAADRAAAMVKKTDQYL